MFGDLLKFIRIKEGYTKTSVAIQSGIPKYYLTAYEENGQDILWSNAIQIFNSLGYDVCVRKRTTGESYCE